MSRCKPTDFPNHVQDLALSLLRGLPLNPMQKEAIEDSLGFSWFKQVQEGEIVLVDICDEMPLLGALLLFRDSFTRGLERLYRLSDADVDADLPLEVLSMVPLLVNMKNFLFALSKVVCARFPGVLPDAFRVNDHGRLVLTGTAVGVENIRMQVKAELALNEVLDSPHTAIKVKAITTDDAPKPSDSLYRKSLH